MTRAAVRGSAEGVAVFTAVTPFFLGAFRSNRVFFFPPAEARADRTPPDWHICIGGLAAEFVATDNNRWCIPVRDTELSTLQE